MLEFLDVGRLPIGPRIDRKISFEIEMLKMDQTIGIKMHQKNWGWNAENRPNKLAWKWLKN